MVESQKPSVRVVLEDGKLLLVERPTEKPTEKVIYEFTIDDLADIIEFRYATPWNRSKDALEKLALVINDIVTVYSTVSENHSSKDDILEAVKLRMI